tara:strand:- start:2199 stop:3596 length:1398 start_codon:yes stop_codon:yes gene_type:complete
MDYRMRSKLWIVDDEESIRTICKSALEESFKIETFSNGSEALLALNSEKPDLIITDIKMPGLSGIDLLKIVAEKYPDLPTIVMTAHADIDNALSAYKGGAFEYLSKPFDVDTIRTLALKAIRNSITETPPQKKSEDINELKIIGKAKSLQSVFRAIGKISKSNISVLIRGESGTGKELIAKSVHENSDRSEKPFVAINVAAIPHDLLESELFGHEKGAFTGAQTQRIGRFEQAHGGTLFLDEIGDMHPELQTRLLRVLSSQEFYRVGGHHPIKSDVRIIAATNQSIETLIYENKFREDLYHRLNVFKLALPPLRERTEDIENLTNFFLKESAIELNTDEKTMDKKVIEFFEQYSWPGNIRQLENICRYLTVMSSSNIITLDDLPDDFTDVENTEGNSDSSSWEDLLRTNIRVGISKDINFIKDINKKLESILIDESLKASKGIKQEAAKLLGWGRNTLAKKAKDN